MSKSLGDIIGRFTSSRMRGLESMGPGLRQTCAFIKNFKLPIFIVYIQVFYSVSQGVSLTNAEDTDAGDLAQACQAIADAMFKSVIHVVFVVIKGERLHIQRTKTGIRYLDVQVRGETYRIMEQNRQKASRYARMARDRHQILWVFKGDQYYARFLDGQFTILKEKEKKIPD